MVPDADVVYRRIRYLSEPRRALVAPVHAERHEHADPGHYDCPLLPGTRPEPRNQRRNAGPVRTVRVAQVARQVAFLERYPGQDAGRDGD